MEDEFWLGAFVIDRWELTDRLDIEGQVRGDWYSETQMDWSGRLSGLYALDDQDKHVWRLGVAKSFRTPFISMREARIHRFPLPGPPLGPGGFLLNMLEPDGLINEQIYSFETGYSGALTDQLTVKVNGYYQVYENLIGARFQPPPFPGAQVIELRNGDGGQSFGLETEFAYRYQNASLSVWHAFSDFEPNQPNQSIRSILPAKHKVGLTGRVHLPDGWTVNTNYKFVDVTHGDPWLQGTALGPPIDEHHRWDVSFAKKLLDDRGELMVGVNDVLDDTELEVTLPGTFEIHETPGRTFYIRFQVQF